MFKKYWTMFRLARRIFRSLDTAAERTEVTGIIKELADGKGDQRSEWMSLGWKIGVMAKDDGK